MDRSSRSVLFLLLPFGSACAASPSRPSMIAERTTTVPVDTASAAHARAVASAATVDTVLVEPRELRLRVGEALPAERLTVIAHDAAGTPIAHFAPVFVLASRVATFDGQAFRGVAAGQAELFVEALPSAPPNVRPRPQPSTRLVVIVEP